MADETVQMKRQFATLAFSMLGWVLFIGTIWYEHRPPRGGEVPVETAHELVGNGFSEGDVSAIPPPRVIHDTKTIPGAERIVYVEVTAPPSEKTAPTVRFVPGNCTAGPQVANWTLRPGDLGLRDGSIDIRKVGRHAFVAFKATITAQTPDGSVERTVEPKEDAWVSTKALGIPPRFGPLVRVTTLPTAEAGVYWSKGRVQYDATAGFDFDRQRWFGGGGVRF